MNLCINPPPLSFFPSYRDSSYPDIFPLPLPNSPRPLPLPAPQVPSSGVVQTTGIPLDREVTESYTIVVEARDSRPKPRIAHVLVQVQVIDINDNAPVFLGLPYFAVVPIDARKGEKT